MASICNDERASFGVMSGHDRWTLSLMSQRRAAPELTQPPRGADDAGVGLGALSITNVLRERNDARRVPR